MYQRFWAEFLAKWSKYYGGLREYYEGLREFPDKTSNFGLLYGRVYGPLVGYSLPELEVIPKNIHVGTLRFFLDNSSCVYF